MRAHCILWPVVTAVVEAATNSSWVTAQLPSISSPVVERELKVDDALNMKSFAYGVPISLSPDGQWLAYTLYNPARVPPGERRTFPFTPNGLTVHAVGRELWVARTAGGKSENLALAGSVAWSGSWSPDGQLLAFFSDRSGVPQLWIWDARTSKVRRVSDGVVHPFYPMEVPKWTPDGRSILVKVRAKGLKSLETRSPATRDTVNETRDEPAIHVYRAAPAGQADTIREGNADLVMPFLADLALITVATGVVRRLVHATAIGDYYLSPSGGVAAYLVPKGWDRINSQDNVSDLRVVSIEDGSVRTLVADVPMPLNGQLSWSPDGSAIAYVSSSFNRPGAADCFVVALSGGQPRIVTPQPHAPLSYHFDRPPIWDSAGKRLYLLASDTLWEAALAPNSHLEPLATLPGREVRSVITDRDGGRASSLDREGSLYLRTRDPGTGRTRVARADVKSGKVRLLFEENAAGHTNLLSHYQVAVSDTLVAYVRQSADAPPDVWVARRGFSGRRQLTRINPALAGYVFGQSRLVDWLSDDGTSLRGALLLPSGYRPGERYPLIVSAYGGLNLSRWMNVFEFDFSGMYNMQLLATRGYAVLMPDSPIRPGTPMRDLAKAILPGVNKLIELGIVDSQRLGLFGHSYGAYTTMSLIVQTPRFAAAVAASGFTNLFTLYGGLNQDGFSPTGWAEEGQGRMGATPWERRERYVENSPYFYLDQVRTPVLLIHGASDSPFSTQETFAALRRLGKEAVYVEYEGVNHDITAGSAGQRRDYYVRVLEWFETHLRRRNDAVVRERK